MNNVNFRVQLLVDRYYGLTGYNKLHEVALRIMLAKFCAETLWSVNVIATPTSTYSVSLNGRLGWDQ